ncbi:unnamed protein product, partial [Larinioides sclopetarius]
YAPTNFYIKSLCLPYNHYRLDEKCGKEREKRVFEPANKIREGKKK